MPVTYDSAVDRAAALRRTAETHGRPEGEIRHPVPDWPDRCARYIVVEESGLSDRSR